MQENDANYMAIALKQAEKGRYTTDPNPQVGCVLVKDSEIIAQGWHERAGQPHAEIEALSKVDNAEGCTAYVTLEPCCHHGKTGPCSQALIIAGVKRVVIAMKDPNPLVAGKGIEQLRFAGIDVCVGVLENQARLLNQGFNKRMEHGMPYVYSKLAMSLDGRTAMANGESQWITSSQSRADVHKLRASVSAVVTGINTVLADDPGLNARVDFDLVQPVRVIMDTQLKFPLDAKMLDLVGETWIFTCSDNEKKIQQLEDKSVRVFKMLVKSHTLEPKKVLAKLAEQQINTVLIEAGAKLNGSFLTANLIDEYWVYMAASVLGHQGRGLFYLPELESIQDKKQFKFKSVRQIGSDIRLKLIPEQPLITTK